jgi:hydrogenase nickel incorporation protein HypA/HybF
MHEFSLAQDIIETIGRSVTGNLSKITAIHIEVGEFSGVVIESLEFGLNVVLQDKNLADVKVNISVVPAAAVCECNYEYPVKDILEACPKCNSYNRKIISGTDVIIKSIEIEE